MSASLDIKNYINSLKETAVSQFHEKWMNIGFQAYEAGASGGSRENIQFQKAIGDELEAFGSTLVSALTKNDALHSPIRKNDFIFAKQKLLELEQELIGIYDKKIERGISFGRKKKRIQPSIFQNQKVVALQELQIAEQAYMSKRSFWKLAFGDIRRAFFTTLVAIGFALIGSLAEKTFNFWELISIFF